MEGVGLAVATARRRVDLDDLAGLDGVREATHALAKTASRAFGAARSLRMWRASARCSGRSQPIGHIVAACGRHAAPVQRSDQLTAVVTAVASADRASCRGVARTRSLVRSGVLIGLTCGDRGRLRPRPDVSGVRSPDYSRFSCGATMRR